MSEIQEPELSELLRWDETCRRYPDQWVALVDGHRPLSTAFDTAASQTHIVPEIIDDLGYSPRQGTAITSVRSAIGKETGYLLNVTKFAALGFAFPDFPVHVHDLLDGIGIDGLLLPRSDGPGRFEAILEVDDRCIGSRERSRP